MAIVLQQLPFPPSVNSLYRNVRGVGRVKSQVYRQYVREFQCWAQWKRQEIDEAREWLITNHNHTVTKIDILFHAPESFYYTKSGKPRRWDLGNHEKAIVDLLCNELKIDDSIFFEMRLKKFIDSEKSVTVSIS